MAQEKKANQRNHSEFFKQLLPQVADRAFDQTGAIVDGHHLYPIRQTTLQLGQLFFHAVDGRLCIFAKAHHHNTTHDFTLTIQLGDATAHLRADANIGNIAQQ